MLVSAAPTRSVAVCGEQEIRKVHAKERDNSWDAVEVEMEMGEGGWEGRRGDGGGRRQLGGEAGAASSPWEVSLPRRKFVLG